jgi:alpha-1,6-mannosyltransferase
MRLTTIRSIGLAQAGIYALLAFFFGWTPRGEATWIDDAAIWGGILALFLLYRAGYLLVSRPGVRCSIRSIVLYIVPSLLLATLTTPFDSTDAFVYLAMSRAQSQYGLNPYTTVLRSIPDIAADPAIGAMWMDQNDNPWLDLPMVYGFLFANVTWFVGWASGGNWWIALFLLKAVFLAAYAFTSWLILAAARLLAHEAPERLLYLFMWSPLVILHQIANAHNDLLMACLLVAAFYLIVRQKYFWTIPVLVAACMIKFTAAVVMPVTLVLLIRKRGLVHAMGSCLMGAVTVLALGLPYVGELRGFIFPLITGQMNKFTAGTLTGAIYYLYRALSRVATPLGTLADFGHALQIVAATAGLVGLGVVAYRFIRSSMSDQETVYAWTLTLFIVLFVSPQFYGWYLAALLPLALLITQGDGLRELIVIFSVTHLTSFASVGSKAIHYFVLATGGGLIWWARKRRKGYKPLL